MTFPLVSDSYWSWFLNTWRVAKILIILTEAVNDIMIYNNTFSNSELTHNLPKGNIPLKESSPHNFLPQSAYYKACCFSFIAINSQIATSQMTLRILA